MKKRYLALALAAVLAVCTAGCGKEEAKDDSNKTAEKGTVDTTEILQAQMPEEGEEIAVIHNLKHNKGITVHTLERLCNILECTPNDVLEFIKE